MAAGPPSVLWWLVVLLGVGVTVAVGRHNPISTGLLQGRGPQNHRSGVKDIGFIQNLLCKREGCGSSGRGHES